MRRIAQDLADRLTRGEHLVLWGPIGSGKTTLLAAIRRRIADRACASAPVTQSLDDITQAFERAFPGVPTQGIPRRAARARLWRAADRAPAVLLLDHVGMVNTAMKGFLRRLRGGIAGVLLVFDIDSPRERARLRTQHLGCLSVRIPALPSRVQRGAPCGTLAQGQAPASRSSGRPSADSGGTRTTRLDNRLRRAGAPAEVLGCRRTEGPSLGP